MLAIEIMKRCCRSSAAATPVKYECNYKKCKRYFCNIKNFAYGEIDERSFSNTHTGHYRTRLI